jgi:hypothetical protein
VTVGEADVPDTSIVASLKLWRSAVRRRMTELKMAEPS